MPVIQLPVDKRAPGRAREFVASVFDEAPEEVRARACQVVSELVTNSVDHAHSRITLNAHSDEQGGFDVDVRDDGPGFEVRPRAAGHAGTHGWGLVFVDMLADSWATGGPGAPVVWAHFEPRIVAAAE